MATNEFQVLIFVDIYSGVSEEKLKECLPKEREGYEVLSLKEYGAPALEPPPNTSPVDWAAIGAAVERVAKKAHELQAARKTPTVLYVGGRGPLSVFVHLGYLFTRSIERIVILNKALSADTWETFPMGMASSAEPMLEPFDRVLGMPVEASSSDGRTGIVVDTGGRTPEKVAYSSFIRENADHVGDIIQLRSTKSFEVTPTNIGFVIRQLGQELTKVPSRCPDQRGIALFAAVPVQVAFAIGMAMNPNILRGDIWLSEHRSGKYEKTYSLPFKPNAAIAIPMDDSSVLKRMRVLEAMSKGIAELKEELKPEHLPTEVLPRNAAPVFIERFKELQQLQNPTEDEPFELRVIEGKYRLGQGILHALVNSTPEQQSDFAKLLLLHEVLHDWQTLRSSNYTSIGRACFVLEQVDYAADVFALRTLMNMELAMGGERAHKNVSTRLRYWIEMVLHGIQSFDLMEQGTRMERLPERRLRRYLQWHLHLAQAGTVRQAAHVDEMFRRPLTVELAPLAGKIDTERYEKVVIRAVPETELFIAIGGHLVRPHKRPGFEPGSLVEAVRNYAHEPIQKVMFATVNDSRSALAPWREGT